LEAGEDLDDVWNEVNFLRGCSHDNIVAYYGCYIKKGESKGSKIIWVYSQLIIKDCHGILWWWVSRVYNQG
jgi:hypothetical protein